MITTLLRFGRDHLSWRTLAAHFSPEERRLVLQSIIVGVVVWATTFALKTSVHWLFERTLQTVNDSGPLPLILIPLTLGALATAAVVRWRAHRIFYRDDDGHVHALADVEGDGLERAIALYHAAEPVFEQALMGQEGVEARWQMPTFSLGIRKFLATLFTLGLGGSGGLEASVTLIGESVSAGLFKPRRIRLGAGRLERRADPLRYLWRWWRSADPDHLQTAQLSGIAAAIATLLGTPFAAAFFATEVMYRKRPVIEKLIYSLIAALVAFFLTSLVSGHPTIFEVEQRLIPPTSLRYYLILMGMAALISVVALLFVALRRLFEQQFQTRFSSPWLRHVAGAWLAGLIALSALGLLALLARQGLVPATASDVGLALILGPGEEVINAALAGRLVGWVAVVALVGKVGATLSTIGSGGSAGLLVPAIYIGTMVAAGLAPLAGLPAMVLVVPAITASLVAIVNVPLAAILLAVELFGATYMVPALIVLVVTFILSHHNTIYRTQRETLDGRQIVPGYSVRRLPIPAAWAGQTLISLNLRRQYEVNVIGLLERHATGRNAGVTREIRMDPSIYAPLHGDDVLIVLGRDEQLESFALAVDALQAAPDGD